jgi:hypothetical protein
VNVVLCRRQRKERERESVEVGLLVLWRVRDLNGDLRENVGESESTRWFYGEKCMR